MSIWPAWKSSTDSPHMPSARSGTGDPGAAVSVDPDAFALYHRVHARWYRIAGVDPGERRGGEPGARARHSVSEGGAVRSYRDAIHRGTGGARRGPQGPDRGGCHPAEAVPDRDLLNGRHATPARVRACVDPPGVGGIRAGPRGRRGGGGDGRPCSTHQPDSRLRPRVDVERLPAGEPHEGHTGLDGQVHGQRRRRGDRREHRAAGATPSAPARRTPDR